MSHSRTQNLYKSPYDPYVREILKCLAKESLTSLVKSASAGKLKAENDEEAVDAILLTTPSVVRFFNYRVLNTDILHRYLLKKKIAFDKRSAKHEIIHLIISTWDEEIKNSSNSIENKPEKIESAITKKEFEERNTTNEQITNSIENTILNQYTSLTDTNRTISDTITSPNQTVININVNITSGETRLGAQENGICTVKSDIFTQKFLEWYYTAVNKLQPECDSLPGDVLTTDFFCSNSCLEINCHSGTEIIQKQAQSQTEVYKLLTDFLLNSKILYNPNVETGFQAVKSGHGLVKIICLGTLHQNNALVGVFEQEFGIVKSPADKRWKIVTTRINHRQSSQTTVPQLPQSEVFEIEP